MKKPAWVVGITYRSLPVKKTGSICVRMRAK
ncbi:MAG: hypothetical protein MESAZ_03019 [Saezia sanguinis]